MVIKMETKGNWSKLFVDPEFSGEAQMGMYYRSMKLGQFIKETEAKGYQIIGIKVDESNNCEFYFVNHNENNENNETDRDSIEEEL